MNDLDSQQSVSTLVHTIKVMVQLPNKGVNKEEAKAEILEKIKYYEGFVQAINKSWEMPNLSKMPLLMLLKRKGRNLRIAYPILKV